MSKTKKIIVMSSLVLLLAVTAVLNVVLARSRTASGSADVVSANYFSCYKFFKECDGNKTYRNFKQHRRCR